MNIANIDPLALFMVGVAIVAGIMAYLVVKGEKK